MLPIAKPASNREYPETMVLHFAELVLFWGLGTLHGKIVSDGEAVQAKEWVFYRFCGKFPFLKKQAFFHFPHTPAHKKGDLPSNSVH